MNLESYIRTVPDFPKKGISYKDITPLLQSPEALDFCIKSFTENIDANIDMVVGIESRGYFLATLLAKHFRAGFVPIRKKGKLPYKTLQESYDLEYGQDQLEIHEDAIKAGQKVLIHDDVLATGGTAQAACNLVERLGGEIVQCNFLIELSFLEGRSKLKGKSIHSLLSY
ncbi:MULTISPECIES: adenine phosphoribosyltransferase [Mesonia]|uniref:Adenine phosphoribosyltransferase n=1 Tax=Mesonia oceanica TaxID=2687242 RepID=A0AC61YB45_9FLAO|nr:MULTISPECIES: adenine phosphoribosyltransferase [Mesonia]MAN28155.1 adenine phosphoribosyltransferase [Mesonia sp.]MAQ39501.1 adenine phosphoribosyltransferase [Mesonia sp.]MBJ97000.1 adenine phosphoribosyltransferase [Flavobacteriaceae bacterium]VVV01614.1 Adenine phosphoribosyltransferase [Mesonia oceanica]|tara:strand:+ start:488 stop:997 length:510 start_codon:yes stop_codon:yes gene_type:complete